jgi:hypothetical protein
MKITKTIHEGTVASGAFKPDNPTSYGIAIGMLEGQRATVTVDKYRKRRSTRQNSYYWSVIIPMIKDAGGYVTNEEAHDACRWACLRVEREKGSYCRSTKTLTTIETEEYYSGLRQLAAEGFFGDSVWIPEPNESACSCETGGFDGEIAAF